MKIIMKKEFWGLILLFVAAFFVISPWFSNQPKPKIDIFELKYEPCFKSKGIKYTRDNLKKVLYVEGLTELNRAYFECT